MKKSNLLFLAIVTIALLAVYGFNGQFNKPGIEWREKIDWTNPSISKEQVEQKGKPIFVLVSTKWCRFCNMMKAQTFTDENVQTQMNQNLVSIYIDPETEGIANFLGGSLTFPQFASKFSVNGYPTMLFFTPRGELIGSKSGYLSTDQMLELIDYFDQYSSSRTI
ncbi:MAG: thioredoxin fold domain-containing protein [Candidatus Zixiibacteriota bacterium]